MSEPKPGLQLVPKGKPAAGAEIEMMGIRVLKAIRGLSKEERIKRSLKIGGSLRSTAVLAAEIVALSKAQVIDLVREAPDECEPLLSQFERGSADAKALLDVIGFAENWLKVAIANVEGNTMEVKS
jgi:hypothetical protein